MTKKTFTQKVNGNPLDASEWNELTNYVNQAVDAINDINTGGSSSGGTTIDTSGVISVSSKGNTTLSATKHVNIEPAYVSSGAAGTYGDVQIKPGDDITLESHHRILDKRDEITIKTSNGQDEPNKAPVKLQFIASDMTLSTKGKKGSDSDTMNINVTTGSGKGYLKVRAQAIDLRCEKHGGIALQPKGYDSDGNMNKIKFEHGGGDGLEFGTFNTEKTSIFTNEYRFNKDGIWKMARRKTEYSNKNLLDEGGPSNSTLLPTAILKYKKNNSSQASEYEPADDFYDFIKTTDEQCTTKDIIKTAYSLNNYPGVHTKITSGGNLEIGSNLVYKMVSVNEIPDGITAYPAKEAWIIADPFMTYKDGYFIDTESIKEYYSVSDINDKIKIYPVGTDHTEIDENTPQAEVNFDGTSDIYLDFGLMANNIPPHEGYAVYYPGGFSGYYKLEPQPIPNINIESEAKLKLKGILDFGSTFNFGETDNGIEVQYKLTKKNATKDCGILKVVGVNNHTSNNLVVDGITIAPGQTQEIASCSILDIIKLVNYYKNNGIAPFNNV